MAGYASCHAINDTQLHSMYILTSHVLSHLIYLSAVSLSTEDQKSEGFHLVLRIWVPLRQLLPSLLMCILSAQFCLIT